MFHDRLRATRISRGYTLQKTADYIGVSLRVYQRYEAGTSLPPLDMLVRISDLFNVPADWLLERDLYLDTLGISVDVSLDCPPRRPGPGTIH